MSFLHLLILINFINLKNPISRALGTHAALFDHMGINHRGI